MSSISEEIEKLHKMVHDRANPPHMEKSLKIVLGLIEKEDSLSKEDSKRLLEVIGILLRDWVSCRVQLAECIRKLKEKLRFIKKSN